MEDTEYYTIEDQKYCARVITVLTENRQVIDFETALRLLSSCFSATNHSHRLQTILTTRAWRKGTIQS